MIVLLYILLSFSAVLSSRDLCATHRFNVNGEDIMQGAQGRVLLVVYMPLQCSHCHRQLKELNKMAEYMPDVKMMVFVPGFEAPSLVSRIRQEFQKLTVLRDERSEVASIGMRQHDQRVYDRCGRLSNLLSSSGGLVVPYHTTLTTLQSAVQQSPCGPCDHRSPKAVNAYIKEEARRAQYQKSHAGYQQQQPQRPDYRQNYNQQGRQNYNPQHNDYTRTNPQPAAAYQTPPSPSYNHVQYPQVAPQDPRYRETNQRELYATQNAQSRQNLGQDLAFQQYGGNQGRHQPFVTTTTTSAPVRQGKDSYSEDDDYYDEVPAKVTTTSTPVQTQIPTPSVENPLWPTPQPAYSQYQGMRQYQVNNPFGPIVSENNVPCSAYTDDICYQQQEKLGRAGLSKCCQKGIYFTDLCVPGKCSNTTVQLCCLQKFLQAKYSCCEDPEQSEGNTSTNKFSQCCYNNFVNADECCTREAAGIYWSSVHEICYPNTKVDYSNVKMEVRFSEGMRVVDLSENRLWDYECRYGGNRVQYAYLP